MSGPVFLASQSTTRVVLPLRRRHRHRRHGRRLVPVTHRDLHRDRVVGGGLLHLDPVIVQAVPDLHRHRVAPVAADNCCVKITAGPSARNILIVMGLSRFRPNLPGRLVDVELATCARAAGVSLPTRPACRSACRYLRHRRTPWSDNLPGPRVLIHPPRDGERTVPPCSRHHCEVCH